MCKMRIQIRYFLLTLSLVSTCSLFSRSFGLPEVQNYKHHAYGASNKNWQIAQSETGILYFANADGLLSFDGTYWALPSNINRLGLRSLKIVRNRIYIGSFNDIGYYEYNLANQLEYKSLMKSPELDLLGNVWNIIEFNDRLFFQGENGIAIYFNDKLEKVINAVGRFQAMQISNNRLFVIDKDRGLCEYLGNELKLIPGGELLKNKVMVAMASFGTQKMIIGTHQDGPFIFDGKVVMPWINESSALLKKANIFSIASYTNDYLVFGTIQMGVIITDINGKLVSHIGKDMGLTNNTVLSLFVDKEGNIWCGLDNGIAKIKFKSNVSFLTGYFDIGTGYDVEKIEGNYYFATNQAIYTINEQKLVNPLKDKNDFVKIPGTEGQCWSFYKDEEGILAGHNLGVLSISKSSSTKITPPSVNGVWNFKPVKYNQHLLVAGTYDGIILLEKTNKQWAFKNKIVGFNESSRLIEWQDDRTLFVAHSQKGVFRLSLNQDYSAVVKIDTIQNSDFPNNKGELTMFSHNGELYFSSASSIYTIDANSLIPKPSTLFDSFFERGKYPSMFKPDRFGNVWYFYPKRIGVLRKLEDDTYKNISEPFMPLYSQMVQVFQSVFVFDNGDTFFNIEDGFADYSRGEGSFKNGTEMPINVHLTTFKSLTDTLCYSHFQVNGQPMPQKIVPQYCYQNNSFVVQYTATMYNSEAISFSTFLEGFDKKPVEWISETTRSFTNLKEGKYTFHVKARNGIQVESISLPFVFEIKPPWYRTLFAKAIYLLLILALSYVIFKLLKKYVTRVKLKVTTSQQEEFKLKEQQFAHEALVIEKELIHLRNEKLTSEMHHKENELASLAIHVVQKRDFLSELKEQLVRITRIKEPAEFGRKVGNLIKKIDQDIENESHWEAFERTFELVHATFLDQLKLKHPDLTMREQKLCAYIRMGMSSKEIASLMNISTRAVENNRYKLRQNLGLQQNDNLADYICHL